VVRAGETGTCVLGIESSCDDTGAAVVTADGRVLGESLASQGAIHAPWGGVVPKLAQGAHEEAIDRVVQEALDAAGVAPSDLDAIAVTVGPGLSLCLRVSTYASRRSPASDGINPNPLHCISRDLVGRHAAHTLRRYCTDQTLTRGSGAGTQVGVLKARMMAAEHRVPLIPIHHMEAHTLVARLEAEAPFPFLGMEPRLVASLESCWAACPHQLTTGVYPRGWAALSCERSLWGYWMCLVLARGNPSDAPCPQRLETRMDSSVLLLEHAHARNT
jgi:hypothetical protein